MPADPAMVVSLADQLGQPGPRPVHSALDRPDLHAQSLRSIIVGQTLRTDEDDGLALLMRQLLQGSRQVLDGEPVLLIRDGDQAGGVHTLSILNLSARLPVSREVAVSQEGEEPGLHVRAGLKVDVLAQRLQYYVLHPALGL